MKNYLLPALLLLLLLATTLKYCTDVNRYESLLADRNAKLTTLTTELTTAKLKNGHTLYQMPQKLLGRAEARQLAGTAAKRFKKLDAVVQTQWVVRRDTVWLPYADTARIDTNTLRLPMPLAYTDKWFYLGGTLRPKGLLLDSIGFNAGKVTLLIGEQRRGIFRKPLPVVQVEAENPYIRMVAANNVVVDQRRKRPLLLSRGAMLCYGLVAGFFSRGILLH